MESLKNIYTPTHMLEAATSEVAQIEPNELHKTLEANIKTVSAAKKKFTAISAQNKMLAQEVTEITTALNSAETPDERVIYQTRAKNCAHRFLSHQNLLIDADINLKQAHATQQALVTRIREMVLAEIRTPTPPREAPPPSKEKLLKALKAKRQEAKERGLCNSHKELKLELQEITIEVEKTLIQKLNLENKHSQLMEKAASLLESKTILTKKLDANRKKKEGNLKKTLEIAFTLKGLTTKEKELTTEFEILSTQQSELLSKLKHRNHRNPG